MGRVYAIREDDGARVLLEIECDKCDATIKPHPDIANSGWVKEGITDTFGETIEWYYCPRCK